MGVPAPIVNKLNTAMNKVLHNDEVKKRLKDFGARPLGGSPGDLTVYLNNDYKKWSEVIRAQTSSRNAQ
jgi:tripartite-type tricarboxylate transporter receptor subunit TctC